MSLQRMLCHGDRLLQVHVLDGVDQLDALFHREMPRHRDAVRTDDGIENRFGGVRVNILGKKLAADFNSPSRYLRTGSAIGLE